MTYLKYNSRRIIMKIELDKVYCGDALELMKKIPDDYIDCIITSPPYWAIRDYGVDGQIGLEEHPQDYINKIVDFMREAKRVIKPTGAIFLNLGDSFYSKSSSGQGNNFIDVFNGKIKTKRLCDAYKKTRGKFKTNWLQHKQKMLIPYRIAIKCQDELGLILRNDIHWVKQFANIKTKESYGASMPSSVKDRFNTNSETIFFFVKSPRYYFNLKAIKIPIKKSSIIREKYGRNYLKESPYFKQFEKNRLCELKKTGKNPGDCLHFPFEPRIKKHYATFPSSIPNLFINCGCPNGGIVLDPFLGSGTTAITAVKLGRKYIGFDLNKNYCRMARLNIGCQYPDGVSK